MNWESWLLSGFLATLALSTLLSLSQGIGLTRMNIPYLLGTIVTPDRERAKLFGFGIHILNGWMFSILYVLIFESRHMVSWWFGMLIGVAQALFVLTVGMTLMPSMHPRMASERQGPTVVRQLEPPGFLGLHYGIRTPISVVLAHVAFGIVLGVFYTVR